MIEKYLWNERWEALLSHMNRVLSIPRTWLSIWLSLSRITRNRITSPYLYTSLYDYTINWTWFFSAFLYFTFRSYSVFESSLCVSWMCSCDGPLLRLTTSTDMRCRGFFLLLLLFFPHFFLTLIPSLCVYFVVVVSLRSLNMHSTHMCVHESLYWLLLECVIYEIPEVFGFFFVEHMFISLESYQWMTRARSLTLSL